MGSRRAMLLDERAGGRVLTDVDLRAALAVCALDPVAAVLATARLEQATVSGLRTAGGTLWGFEHDGALRAVCWAGANVVPVVPTDDPQLAARALDAFAGLARAQGRRCSSIVGSADMVLGLWDRLSRTWPAAREVRADQPSMVIDHEPRLAPDPTVRRSRVEEYDLVLPACIRMFTEEVGYSPAGGPGGPYETRVRGLVGAGRSFVRVEREDGRRGPRDTIVFKAELGAVAGGVAQVQGVWVTPERRGEGLSEAGMAAVVQLARSAETPVVSLYVNGYNHRALAAYRAVGFRQVGTYATVLF
ncbi:GNAT family N-acetyltransferase [Cellulomonas septica]|uniref:GNAT family N-acetyltransferase n=1 Tax=Cellulomonas septica TaxID=285080 RepID=A0ABX1JZJ5_9CELL|nr:GNAT family N-acetyltransferase [Cellulomonas septica]NKY39349.1 GNAT family N-acetyltransferase [Cellulomonas septica]